MFKGKIVAAITALMFFVVSAGFAQSLEDNWNNFLHYTTIGRLDLAKGYAQAILDGGPEPVELFALSEANPQGFMILLRVKETAHDAELAELSGKVLDIIEKGRFIRSTDPKIIVAEIKRLSSTARGRLTAVKHLQDAGEYAIPYMLDAMAEDAGREEFANIAWALPQIGRDSIRPLVAALQTGNVVVKAEIIKALGEIGYPQSLAYLVYITETDKSADICGLANQSIRQIDPEAMRSSAARLFYRLAENYYHHAESLAPAENTEFANIWFWDSDAARLVWRKVDSRYFNELMAMRACEWALKADATFGRAIGLWLAAYFKAESIGVGMPDYFGPDHADAGVYATTAGPEYLHQTLAIAIKENNAYVALGAVEALATTAGEKSLLYRIGPAQPLMQALSFDDRAVRYSAAIAIAAAGPKKEFAESKLVAEILAQALAETAEQAGENTKLWNAQLADSYALRAAGAMLELAQSRNTVIDLSIAQTALINATKDSRAQIQVLAARILAYLDSPDAQRSIAAMALSQADPMDIRISAFNCLAISAKLNANLLDEERIDAIYSLVSSQAIDPALRSAAALAYGALNLPSRKIKDLILNQARS